MKVTGWYVVNNSAGNAVAAFWSDLDARTWIGELNWCNKPPTITGPHDLELPDPPIDQAAADKAFVDYMLDENRINENEYDRLEENCIKAREQAAARKALDVKG